MIFIRLRCVLMLKLAELGLLYQIGLYSFSSILTNNDLLVLSNLILIVIDELAYLH